MAENESKAVLLTNVADGIDAPMLMELLKNEGIECWAADSSSGSFLRSTLGFSPTGRQIYVPKEKLEEAQGLLEAYFSQSPTGQHDPYLPQEDELPPSDKQSELSLWIGIIVAAAVLILLTYGLK